MPEGDTSEAVMGGVEASKSQSFGLPESGWGPGCPYKHQPTRMRGIGALPPSNSGNSKTRTAAVRHRLHVRKALDDSVSSGTTCTTSPIVDHAFRLPNGSSQTVWRHDRGASSRI